MNEAIIAATVDIIEQLLGHDSPKPEVITALERVLAGRRREAGMVKPTTAETTATQFGGPIYAYSLTPADSRHQMDTFESGRIQGLREAAEIVRGQIYRTHYRTWPQLGDGDRTNDSEIVRHCDRLAAAIEAAIPAPPPPQSGERERLKAELRDEAKRIRENGSTIMTKFDWADAKQEGRCRQLAAMYLEEFADCMEMQDDAMRAREGE